jgi:hypothetical protein
MMVFIRIVAFLHLVAYVGIMYYGWQSYKLLRKRSWKYMGIGFSVLFVYRAMRFAELMITDVPVDTERVLLPFIGAVFLLTAFWMLRHEHWELLTKMADPPSPVRSGAQPVEYWLENFRKIVREEIAAASTIKAPENP